MSKTIQKKVLKQYFNFIKKGLKTYELRLADWECQTGDILELIEIDGKFNQPTGRTLTRKVGFVGKTKDFDFWSQDEIDTFGYQIISLLNVEEV